MKIMIFDHSMLTDQSCNWTITSQGNASFSATKIDAKHVLRIVLGCIVCKMIYTNFILQSLLDTYVYYNLIDFHFIKKKMSTWYAYKMVQRSRKLIYYLNVYRQYESKIGINEEIKCPFCK
jgi:hypothetical protein